MTGSTLRKNQSVAIRTEDLQALNAAISTGSSLNLTTSLNKVTPTGIPPLQSLQGLPSLAALPLLDDDEDEKPKSKAMKLLGLEESDALTNNSKVRANTIKERRDRLVPANDNQSNFSRDSSQTTVPQLSCPFFGRLIFSNPSSFRL